MFKKKVLNIIYNTAFLVCTSSRSVKKFCSLGLLLQYNILAFLPDQAGIVFSLSIGTEIKIASL